MTSTHYPTFDDELLNAVSDELRRRSKSLKHRTSSISIQKVFEQTSDGRYEKLEGEVRTDSTRRAPTIRFNLWHDRLLWLDARRLGQSGWDWTWTSEGRLAGAVSGGEIGSAVERTIKAIKGEALNRQQIFEAIWQPYIAKGPREV